MIAPPHIRSITAADYAGWRPLWDGYNAFYGRSGATALPDEITQTTWRRFLDPDEPVHAIVAERNGRLVGLAHYLYHRSTTTIALTCYLRDLFTQPDLRGHGIGRALIEGVYGRASDAGAASVYWQTHETNVTAMRLYDQMASRSGFVVYSKPLSATDD